MKHNNIFRSIIAFLLIGSITLFSSCTGKSPKSFQGEIEDCVRYTIAVCNVSFGGGEMNKFRSASIKQFTDTVEESWENEESETAYRDILERMSEGVSDNSTSQSDGSNFLSAVMGAAFDNLLPSSEKLAASVLKEYDRLDIILSEYNKVATSSDTELWEFRELNSGIVFHFRLTDEGWDCEPEETSLSKYCFRIS